MSKQRWTAQHLLFISRQRVNSDNRFCATVTYVATHVRLAILHFRFEKCYNAAVGIPAPAIAISCLWSAASSSHRITSLPVSLPAAHPRFIGSSPSQVTIRDFSSAFFFERIVIVEHKSEKFLREFLRERTNCYVEECHICMHLWLYTHTWHFGLSNIGWLKREILLELVSTANAYLLNCIFVK